MSARDLGRARLQCSGFNLSTEESSSTAMILGFPYGIRHPSQNNDSTEFCKRIIRMIWEEGQLEERNQTHWECVRNCHLYHISKQDFTQAILVSNVRHFSIPSFPNAVWVEQMRRWEMDRLKLEHLFISLDRALMSNNAVISYTLQLVNLTFVQEKNKKMPFNLEFLLGKLWWLPELYHSISSAFIYKYLFWINQISFSKFFLS